jgi:hypothetical protein
LKYSADQKNEAGGPKKFLDDYNIAVKNQLYRNIRKGYGLRKDNEDKNYTRQVSDDLINQNPRLLKVEDYIQGTLANTDFHGLPKEWTHTRFLNDKFIKDIEEKRFQHKLHQQQK